MDIFIHFLCEGRLIKQVVDIFPIEIIRYVSKPDLGTL